METKFDRFKRRSIDFYVVDKQHLVSMEGLRKHLEFVENSVGHSQPMMDTGF